VAVCQQQKRKENMRYLINEWVEAERSARSEIKIAECLLESARVFAAPAASLRPATAPDIKDGVVIWYGNPPTQWDVVDVAFCDPTDWEYVSLVTGDVRRLGGDAYVEIES
jgi:hypothetical protein